MSSQPSSAEAPKQQSSRTNDVFISYSRRDKAFVEILEQAFRKIGRDPWIDWDDIRKGEDWWNSIKRGIESADTFLFVVTPDSIASKVCLDEIEYATKCNKRFLPIIRREGFDPQQVHSSISRHNWLFFRETDNLKTAFQDLLEALDTDLDHVSTHTRLLVRALEWDTKHRDASYLLRGRDLKEAGQWLTQGVNKDPRPTDVHADYVGASLDANEAIVRSRQKAKYLVVLTTVIANLIFISLGLLAIDLSLSGHVRREIAADMATTLNTAVQGIDGDEFAKLAQFPPNNAAYYQNNPLYQKHQQWLNTIHVLVPDAYPETYIRSQNPRQIEIIGDIARDLKPGAGYAFRQVVDASGQAQLDGLQTEITRSQRRFNNVFDDWFYYIYAPIRDSNNNLVGAISLAYTASYVQDLRGYIGGVMRTAFIIAALWFMGSAWLILRATRLPKELAHTSE
ncbi:MAG: TIR domain-containing protein [Cyanobacteria bacterium P01_D01_bin.156]